MTTEQESARILVFAEYVSQPHSSSAAYTVESTSAASLKSSTLKQRRKPTPRSEAAGLSCPTSPPRCQGASATASVAVVRPSSGSRDRCASCMYASIQPLSLLLSLGRFSGTLPLTSPAACGCRRARQACCTVLFGLEERTTIAHRLERRKGRRSTLRRPSALWNFGSTAAEGR